MIFWEKQKALSALYAKLTKPLCEKYGLTQIEYDVIMFLHNNPQYKTASDIVKIRKLTKSHVSMAITQLEKKGYISKRYSNENKKSVILTITNAANDVIADGEKTQLLFGRIIFDGFSENETECFRDMLFKIYENANNFLTNK